MTHGKLRVGLLFFVGCVSTSVGSEIFSGATGQPIAGQVAGDVEFELVLGPGNGSLTDADGNPGLGNDGSFVYLPNAGFSGADHFVFTRRSEGDEPEIREVRLFSGPVQVLSADDRSLALAASSAGNRSPVTLAPAGQGAATLWQVAAAGGSVRLLTQLAADGAAALETWQPNSAGTQVTVYAANGRPWQNFYFTTSNRGNDQIRSRHTNFSLQRAFGGVTAQPAITTVSGDWLLAGENQTAPPSPRDDVYSGDVDQLIRGDVLLNDQANSIDFASFLATGPRHGSFVGINADIYGGLAPFGNFDYQPDPGFEGTDHFTYVVKGSARGAPSRLVTVTLRVGEIDSNDPVATDDVFVSAVDSPISARVLRNDFNAVDGFFDPQAVLVSPPRFGEFFGINESIYGGLAPFGDFDYQPNAGFEGLDSFSYRIINSGEASAVATVFLVVGQVHVAPSANWRLVLDAFPNRNRTPFTLESPGNASTQAFELLPTSVQGQFQLAFGARVLETWQPRAQGLEATLYANNGQLWQLFQIASDPLAGGLVIESAFTGRQLAAASSSGGSPVGTELPADDARQRWLIAGLNQSFGPVARDDALTTQAGVIVEGNVLSNDESRGFDIGAFLISGPANGTLGQNVRSDEGVALSGQFAYEPDPGFVGTDEFVYLALSSSNGAPSRYATVRITVQP
ncbi:MAG: Ig-like domain-containing protein [Pseudomonadota bacterium]